MNLKRMSIAGAAVIAGIGILAGPRVVAWAQTLAGMSAAAGAGATLGAAGGAGYLGARDFANRKIGEAMNSRQGMPDAENRIPDGTLPEMPSATIEAQDEDQQQPTAPKVQPEKWGNENGQEMLGQLTRGRASRPGKTGRRHISLPPVSKPQKGWQSYYLKEDRYKLNQKVWQFVTTPNDKYYYQPWVLAAKHRPASQVIGFHTWQDAMIAGYRPDPRTLPTPGRQLATMSSYSNGPMMQRYTEYAYGGQITPVQLAQDYNYVMKVAHQVESSRDWNYLLVPTVESAIGSTLGLNPVPQYVGSMPEPQQQEVGPEDEMMDDVPAPDALPPGGMP